MCRYVCLHVSIVAQEDQRCWEPLELKLQKAVRRWMWVLGTKLWNSSGRDADVLTTEPPL